MWTTEPACIQASPALLSSTGRSRGVCQDVNVTTEVHPPVPLQTLCVSVSANTGVSGQLAMNLTKALQHAADGSSPMPSIDGLLRTRVQSTLSESRQASIVLLPLAPVRRAHRRPVACRTNDLVQAIRGAAAESTPPSGVQSLQALLARLDLVRKNRSEVHDAAKMHRPMMSPVVFCVSKSANSGFSDQLAFDLRKSVLALPMDRH